MSKNNEVGNREYTISVESESRTSGSEAKFQWGYDIYKANKQIERISYLNIITEDICRIVQT